MISVRIVAFAAAAWYTIAVPQSAGALSEYNIPLGVRSMGMGETGTADTTDVANIAHNPALLSMLTGYQFTYGFLDYDWAFGGVEHVSGAVFGGGYRRKIGEIFLVGTGGALGYAERNFGIEDESGARDVVHWYTRTKALHFAGGVMAGYRGFAYAGIGLSAKRYETNNERITFLPAGICYPGWKAEASPVDAGFFLRLVPYRRDGRLVTATGGFTYFHAAGEVKTGVNCPSSTVYEAAQYAFRRYALNLSVSTPPWSRATRYFGADVPALAVSASFDYQERVDSRFQNSGKYLGAELGLIGTVYFRAGLESEEQDPDNNKTYGIGIAFNKRRAHARFDYARMPEPNIDAVQHRYGFTYEVDL